MSSAPSRTDGHEDRYGLLAVCALEQHELLGQLRTALEVSQRGEKESRLNQELLDAVNNLLSRALSAAKRDNDGALFAAYEEVQMLLARQDRVVS